MILSLNNIADELVREILLTFGLILIQSLFFIVIDLNYLFLIVSSVLVDLVCIEPFQFILPCQIHAMVYQASTYSSVQSAFLLVVKLIEH